MLPLLELFFALVRCLHVANIHMSALVQIECAFNWVYSVNSFIYYSSESSCTSFLWWWIWRRWWCQRCCHSRYDGNDFCVISHICIPEILIFIANDIIIHMHGMNGHSFLPTVAFTISVIVIVSIAIAMIVWLRGRYNCKGRHDACLPFCSCIPSAMVCPVYIHALF